MSEPEDDVDIDDDIITCWCGAEGTYDELFDDSGLPESCGGLGVMHCECAGSFCQCHNHGEVQCDGCEDCEDDWDEDDDFYYEDD